MISGGNDTTNNVLIAAISLILRNSCVLEKVKSELDIQIGKKEIRE